MHVARARVCVCVGGVMRRLAIDNCGQARIGTPRARNGPEKRSQLETMEINAPRHDALDLQVSGKSVQMRRS